LLARAVVPVADMWIPEAAREAVLARLTADRASQNGGLPNCKKAIIAAVRFTANLGNP
jgi:hypothetical protein